MPRTRYTALRFKWVSTVLDDYERVEFCYRNSGCERTLELPKPNLACFDLHPGRRDVELDADEAVQLAASLVIIDDGAHDAPVDELDNAVPARDDVNIVPVVILDDGL